MEVLRESTAVSEVSPTSVNISGPYISPERTESIPLKGTPSKPPNLFYRCCLTCFGFADEDANSGLKFIVASFFVLSVAVSVALAAQIYHGDYQIVPHGSVATDSRECSLIGTSILKKGGNAVDAAVASTLCMGVVNPHITGIGGGGFMLVYDHRKQVVLKSLDFRETAPMSVTLPPKESTGRSSVGVPGLLRGLAFAHRAHGRLSWKEVVMPAVSIAKSGFHISKNLVESRVQLPSSNNLNSRLHNMLDSLEAGNMLSLPSLSRTLEIISEEGPDALYNGTLSTMVLSAVEGSALTAKDLAAYRPVEREPLHGNFAGFDIIVPGAPSGGPLLLAALESVSALNLSQSSSEDNTLLLFRLAKAIQLNYPGFFSESGDPDFTASSTPDLNRKEIPHLPTTVYSHVASVDLNDLYVSVVSGHNSLFGSQILTEGGFILNNALSSFDTSFVKGGSPSSSSAVFANPYPLSPNSTITIAKVAHLPEGAINLDHRPPPSGSSQSELSHLFPLEHREVPEYESPHFEEVLPFPPRNSNPRKKRSDAFESEPRAAIWGSSAANNGISGGKRPISLATPAIAVENGQICGRRLILGGSDAGVIAQVLTQLLVLDGNVISSIEAPRVSLELSGAQLALEHWYGAQLTEAKQVQLAKMGFKIQTLVSVNPSINIVEKRSDTLASHSDSRGEGVASRF